MSKDQRREMLMVTRLDSWTFTLCWCSFRSQAATSIFAELGGLIPLGSNEADHEGIAGALKKAVWECFMVVFHYVNLILLYFILVFPCVFKLHGLFHWRWPSGMASRSCQQIQLRQELGIEPAA